MESSRRFWGLLLLTVCGLFVFTGVSHALELSLEPSNVQREIGGKVRVHIYANSASSLLSMGIKVSFNPNVLQVVEAKKFEKDINGDVVWLMDADGDPATTDDQYANPAVEVDNAAGTVMMIGGHLTGASTTGLSGKVLLGWIVFEAIANGTSTLNVDLAKYGPDPQNKTFMNFVNTDGTVDEPANVPEELGVICVVENACYADQDGDGDVDAVDKLRHRLAAPSTFPSQNYTPAADIDADGDVDAVDKLRFRLGSPRNDCPVCP